MVAKKVELNPSALIGGRPQIVRLRLVNFDIDGCVSCSCELFERVGIVFRHTVAIIQVMDETMCDIRRREALGFYFGVEMYEHVSSVVMKALLSSLKKIKCHIPPEPAQYPSYNDGAQEVHFAPFVKCEKSECF
jgi:hypothetical protein